MLNGTSKTYTISAATVSGNDGTIYSEPQTPDTTENTTTEVTPIGASRAGARNPGRDSGRAGNARRAQLLAQRFRRAGDRRYRDAVSRRALRLGRHLSRCRL